MAPSSTCVLLSGTANVIDVSGNRIEKFIDQGIDIFNPGQALTTVNLNNVSTLSGTFTSVNPIGIRIREMLVGTANSVTVSNNIISLVRIGIRINSIFRVNVLANNINFLFLGTADKYSDTDFAVITEGFADTTDIYGAVDIINFNSASKELQEIILKEGIVMYERKS